MDNNPANEGERAGGGRLVIYAEIFDEEDPGDVPLEEEPIEMEADDGESAEEEHFDITLAARHSYMGPELQEVSGRNVLEAGWRGVMPGALYHSCVFPGETVPLLLQDGDANTIADALKKDRLFALLSHVESQEWKGFGVVCEVFEAAEAAAAAPARYKARALHRCRARAPRAPPRLAPRNKMRAVQVEVLGEAMLADPLRAARLPSLDAARRHDTQHDRPLRLLDAMLTPWPLFLYDMFHFGRMRDIIKDYFKTLNLERMVPTEAVALSFWAARNLTLSERDRCALFAVDNTLERLHMECDFIKQASVVCCGGCGAQLARREHVFAMSSDGVHSTYTNPDGYMHDIVTVTTAANTELTGRGSAAYSWFPGYRWTCAVCARCMAHVGWRFDALRRNLRPAHFYGLCRNYAAPQEENAAAAAAREGEGEGEALLIPLVQFRFR